MDVTASQEIQIKVSASKGTLTLGGVTTNLIFVEGNGVNDAEIEFKGKLNDINLAFEALTYHALPNENGKSNTKSEGMQNGALWLSIFIPLPSFKPISLSLSCSPLL